MRCSHFYSRLQNTDLLYSFSTPISKKGYLLDLFEKTLIPDFLIYLFVVFLLGTWGCAPEYLRKGTMAWENNPFKLMHCRLKL